MLLRRILPGTVLLAEPDDDKATQIAATVMQQIWQAAGPRHPHPKQAEGVPGTPEQPTLTVGEWAQGLARLRGAFNGGTGPFPPRLVDKAEGLFADLLADSAAAVLLHGDLHHENILLQTESTGKSTPVVIDPKGIWGEPAYEPGAWLRNPMSGLHTWVDPRAVLARRLAIFSEVAALDPRRVAGWAFAQAVLSAWWHLEDHGLPQDVALPVAVPVGKPAVALTVSFVNGAPGKAAQPVLKPDSSGLQRALTVAEWLDPFTP